MSVLTAKSVFVVSVLTAKPVFVVSVGHRVFQKKSLVYPFFINLEKFNYILLDACNIFLLNFLATILTLWDHQI